MSTSLQEKIKIQKEAEKEHERIGCRSTCALSVGMGKGKIAINRISKKIKKKNVKILFSSAREVYLDNFKMELEKFKHKAWIDKIDFCCNKSLKNKKDIYDLIIIDESHKEVDLYLDFLKSQIEKNKDVEILCLTGTPIEKGSDLFSKDSLYNIVPISYKKTIDSAISENLLNDYTITVLYHDLSNTELANIPPHYHGRKNLTEVEYYSHINALYEKSKLRPKKAAFSYELGLLKLFFKNLKSKEILAKTLLNKKLKDRKVLVYAGSIEQSENFNLKCYHSNLSKEERKQNYSDFFNDKFKHLINVEGLREAVSIPNLTDLLLLSPDASYSAFEQKLGRGCRLAVNQKANFIVLCAKNTIEEFWVEKAIKNLDIKKIQKFYVGNNK